MASRRAKTEGVKAEALHVVTGCTTREQFASLFSRFCDGKICFIPTVETRPVGSSLSFSVQLADGTPMLQGTCVVKAAWREFDSPHLRPGVQLEIKRLSAESKTLYQHLLSNGRTGEATRPIAMLDIGGDAGGSEPTSRATPYTVQRKVPKPPPIPSAAFKRSSARSSPASARAQLSSPHTAPLPDGIVPAHQASSMDSAPTVMLSHPVPVPVEALPALDSVPTRVVEMLIPAEAVPAPPPRVTAATVPSRRSKQTTANPFANIDDSALDAFLDCTMAEVSDDAPLDHDDTTVH